MNNGNVYKGVASDDSDSYVKDDSLTKLTSSEHVNYGNEAIQCRKLPEVPARGDITKKHGK